MKMTYHVKHCSPECPWCAKRYWAWLKDRMFNADRPRRGESESFGMAAVNSASRFEKGDRHD